MKNSPKPPAPDQRRRALTLRRNLKMARSAHSYVRGATEKFYEWLDTRRTGELPVGPAIWICGDCHVGNLGPVANAAGRIEVQIRDLDQTVIGNPAHDLVRLGLSLASSARGSDLPGVATARMLEHLMQGYEMAFEPDFDPDEDLAEPASIASAVRLSVGASWKTLATARLDDARPTIPLGKRFWPISPEESAGIEGVFAHDDLRGLATMLRSRDDNSKVELLDAAYWRKGCSSLGRLRYAALLAVTSKNGKGKNAKARDYCLMDLKEAVASAAPHAKGASMPPDEAARVVEGAINLSPHLGKRMRATRLLDRPVFVRELLPQDLQLEIDRLTRQEAVKVAAYLAAVVGKAHSRQMSAADRKSWQAELSRNRSGALDAPGWLWSSVVDLMAGHERAYLEHCRIYALEEDSAVAAE